MNISSVVSSASSRPLATTTSASSSIQIAPSARLLYMASRAQKVHAVPVHEQSETRMRHGSQGHGQRSDSFHTNHGLGEGHGNGHGNGQGSNSNNPLSSSSTTTRNLIPARTSTGHATLATYSTMTPISETSRENTRPTILEGTFSKMSLSQSAQLRIQQARDVGIQSQPSALVASLPGQYGMASVRVPDSSSSLPQHTQQDQRHAQDPSPSSLIYQMGLEKQERKHQKNIRRNARRKERRDILAPSLLDSVVEDKTRPKTEPSDLAVQKRLHRQITKQKQLLKHQQDEKPSAQQIESQGLPDSRKYNEQSHSNPGSVHRQWNAHEPFTGNTQIPAEPPMHLRWSLAYHDGEHEPMQVDHEQPQPKDVQTPPRQQQGPPQKSLGIGRALQSEQPATAHGSGIGQWSYSRNHQEAVATQRPRFEPRQRILSQQWQKGNRYPVLTERDRATMVLERPWTSAPGYNSANGGSDSNTFTVMTYNLLANSLMASNPFLYRNSSTESLYWDNRVRRILREMSCMRSSESKSLDMYCLQELDETDYHDTFRPTLEKWGYGSVFKKRNGDKTDGCAFFYRQSTVEVIEIRTVDYHTNAFVDRDNIGIVALLDLKQANSETPQRLCIATTHLLFNPKRGMIKLAQLRMLLEEAESMIRRAHSEDTPFVLCGDMNALPQSMIVKYLINESVDVSTMPETYMSGQEKGKIPRGCFHNSIDTFCKAFQPTLEENKNGDDQGPETGQETENGKISPVISQPFALKSTYPIPGSRRGPSRTGHDEYWTTFHLMAKQVCDYIFYGYLRTSSLAKTSTYHGEQVRLEAVSNLRLPCSELSKSCKGLPALDFGSDHLSLVTKFRFVKEAAKQRKKAARTIE